MAEYIDRTQIKWYGCDHEGKECIDSGGDCAKCFFGNCDHDEVMNMKPADVAPVIHAKWEHDNYGHIYCSYCKADSLTTHKSLYCPACGAKMDKE